MFNYMFDNPSEFNEVLQFVTLFLLFVIGAMLYFMANNTDELQQTIEKLELSCPEAPPCPSLTCNDEGKCPECPVSDCPIDGACPPCKEGTFPTVDDIVSGIFPGRTTGITSGGKYFDIKANESYELMPDYDFYQAADAFPEDSILGPPETLLGGNPQVPPNKINNTRENELMNTRATQAIDTRMDMASSGDNTAASQLPALESDNDFPVGGAGSGAQGVASGADAPASDP
jgi:hypothetical protein